MGTQQLGAPPSRPGDTARLRDVLLTPEMFGAVGDGTADDSSALQTMLNVAGGKTVFLAPSKSYRHTVVLTVSQDATTIRGGGTLLATAEQTSSVLVTGNFVTMRGITLKVTGVTQRWNEYEKMKLRVVGSNFYADTITIDGSAAAGIYNMAAYPRFDKPLIKNTRADAIFTSEGAHHTLIVSAVAENPGDDGFSVVSYANAPVYEYTNIGSSVYNGGARGFSVVGGTDIKFFNIYSNTTAGAGVLLSSENDSYANANRVVVCGGQILNANASTSVDHGAIIITAAQTRTIQNVDLSGFIIRGTRAAASGQLRFIRYDTSAINDISLSNVAIFGGPTTVLDFYQVSAVTNRIMLSNVVKDGVPVRGQSVVATLPRQTLATGTTIYAGISVPAGGLSVGSRFRITLTFSNPAVAATQAIAARWGANGTAADAAIVAMTTTGTANADKAKVVLEVGVDAVSTTAGALTAQSFMSRLLEAGTTGFHNVAGATSRLADGQITNANTVAAGYLGVSIATTVATATVLLGATVERIN